MDYFLQSHHDVDPDHYDGILGLVGQETKYLHTQVLRNTKKRSTYDSISSDGVPGKSGRAPAWTPSGGDPHFDAWLRRWMRDNG